MNEGNQVKNLFMNLNELEDKGKLEVKKRIRYKHFMEDLSFIIHLFYTENRSENINKMVKSDFEKILNKRIGVKILKWTPTNNN